MGVPGVPADIEDLLRRRQRARAEKDYALADRLREQVARAGWEVRDGPEGQVVESALDRVESHAGRAAVESQWGAPDLLEFSLCIAAHGWVEDIGRLVAALAGAGERLEAVVVDVRNAGIRPRDIAPAAAGPAVRVISLREEVGHAEAWNVAARLARGRLLFFVEPSLEFESAVLDRLAAALEDPDVGLAGPYGLDTSDGHNFEPSTKVEVAALEYLLALRRADMERVGEFDRRFHFYRNLDIHHSHQARAAGLRVVRVDCGPVTRHPHRLWESTPAGERERLSRKNFNHFLERFGQPLTGAGGSGGG